MSQSSLFQLLKFFLSFEPPPYPSSFFRFRNLRKSYFPFEEKINFPGLSSVTSERTWLVLSLIGLAKFLASSHKSKIVFFGKRSKSKTSNSIQQCLKISVPYQLDNLVNNESAKKIICGKLIHILMHTYLVAWPGFSLN